MKVGLKILTIFFSSCVDSQPGLIQLLIGVKSNVQVGKPLRFLFLFNSNKYSCETTKHITYLIIRYLNLILV
jgi:hypothetical protein